MCVQQSFCFGGGGIMVWGAISHGWKSALVIVDGNLSARRCINQIVLPHVILGINQINQSMRVALQGRGVRLRGTDIHAPVDLR